jgi:hypothetical protein
MAKDLHDHVHLFLASQNPTGATATQWHIAFPGLNPRPSAAVDVRRGLTGVAQIHTLRDTGTGKIVQFKDVTLRFVATPTEHDALLALNGEKCYYVPHEHDDAGADIKHDAAAAVQGYPVVAVITEDMPLDASLQYYFMTMQLTDNSRQ